jgi:hypothetical protein
VVLSTVKESEKLEFDEALFAETQERNGKAPSKPRKEQSSG